MSAHVHNVRFTPESGHYFAYVCSVEIPWKGQLRASNLLILQRQTFPSHGIRILAGVKGG
jgi:hypothetical protein